jgi:hypothetical protein
MRKGSKKDLKELPDVMAELQAECCVVQEVGTRLERMHEQISEIRQNLKISEGAQAVYVNFEVFRRREVLCSPEKPQSTAEPGAQTLQEGLSDVALQRQHGRKGISDAGAPRVLEDAGDMAECRCGGCDDAAQAVAPGTSGGLVRGTISQHSEASVDRVERVGSGGKASASVGAPGTSAGMHDRRGVTGSACGEVDGGPNGDRRPGGRGASHAQIDSEGTHSMQRHGASPGAAQNGKDEGEREDVVEIHESVGVSLTLDLYEEFVQGLLAELEAGFAELQAMQAAVNETFRDVATYYGERPQAVKEHEWWATLIKFLKTANGIQAAILKGRADAEAQELRKARRNQSIKLCS